MVYTHFKVEFKVLHVYSWIKDTEVSLYLGGGEESIVVPQKENLHCHQLSMAYRVVK